MWLLIPLAIIAALAMSSSGKARVARYDASSLKPLPPGIPPVPDLPKLQPGLVTLSDYEIKMGAWLKAKYQTRFVTYERGGKVWYITLELPPGPDGKVQFGRKFALASDGQTEVPYYDND